MQELRLAPLIEVLLGVGQETVVPLGGAGSFGYGWHVTAEGDAAAVDESIEAADLRGGEHAGAPQVLRVQGVRAGHVMLRLRLVPHSRPDQTPLKEMAVGVKVRG